MRKAILLDVKFKFGKDKVNLVKQKIENIDDIKKLESIKIKVIRAKNWDEFLKILDRSVRKISTKSKWFSM